MNVVGWLGVAKESECGGFASCVRWREIKLVQRYFTSIDINIQIDFSDLTTSKYSVKFFSSPDK